MEEVLRSVEGEKEMIEYMTLGDVCTDIIDCPHESPEWKSEGIPVIRNFNLVNGQIDMQDGYYVDEDTYIKRTHRAVPCEGDIVFSREAPIGNCAIVPSSFKCCLGQRLVLMKINHKVCSSEYLLTVLQSSYVKQQIKQVSKRGSIVSNFNIGDLRELVIPVLDNQEDIAKLSSVLAEKISNNTSICSDLESMAKLLYDYWFVQFDFPDENGKPYKSSGGKMVWNEELKKEIPAGWEVSTIGDITICHDSERIPVANKDREAMKGNIPYYGATGIMGYVNRAIFSGDYVLMAEDGSVMDECGNPIIQRISGNVWVNNHAHVLEPTNGYSCRLLMMILKDIPVTKIKTGSIQMKINQENMNAYKIALIPDRLIEAINNPLKLIDARLLSLEKENQQLSSLRDFLLPMLMNGQVKVK